MNAGTAVEELQQKAKDLQLTNTRFYPLQAYADLPFLMAFCWCAFSSAEKETELGLLCNNFPGIAECVEPEDLGGFCDGLQLLLDQVNTNQRLINQVARDYAVEFLNKEQVLSRFEADLLRL